jgi:hypothetical protein
MTDAAWPRSLSSVPSLDPASTGALTAGALVVGALIAGAPPAVVAGPCCAAQAS